MKNSVMRLTNNVLHVFSITGLHHRKAISEALKTRRIIAIRTWRASRVIATFRSSIVAGLLT